MEILKLTAQLREGTGKSYTRRARENGWVPAVYYGHNRETKSIEVSAKDFGAFLRARKTSHLMDLGLPGEKGSIAIVKEIQHDVLIPDHLTHIDFQHVEMGEKITTQVPLEINGVAKGVKESSGTLGHPVQFLTVECLPSQLPEKISIDVSDLDVNEAIHVRDLAVEEGVEIKDPPDEVLATVTVERQAEPEEAVGEETAEGAEPAEGGEES